jgi:hypothetical protein
MKRFFIILALFSFLTSNGQTKAKKRAGGFGYFNTGYMYTGTKGVNALLPKNLSVSGGNTLLVSLSFG